MSFLLIVLFLHFCLSKLFTLCWVDHTRIVFRTLNLFLCFIFFWHVVMARVYIKILVIKWICMSFDCSCISFSDNVTSYVRTYRQLDIMYTILLCIWWKLSFFWKQEIVWTVATINCCLNYNQTSRGSLFIKQNCCLCFRWAILYRSHQLQYLKAMEAAIVYTTKTWQIVERKLINSTVYI